MRQSVGSTTVQGVTASHFLYRSADHGAQKELQELQEPDRTDA